MRKWFSGERSVSKSVRSALTTVVFFVAVACGDQGPVTAVAVDSVDSSVRIGSVRVDPATVSASVGDSGTFVAIVTDRYGRVVSGATVTWSSSNPAVVNISASGLARAIAPGTANIVATSGGKFGTAVVTITGSVEPTGPVVASVEVSPGAATGYVGDSAQFTATARDANGVVIEGRTVSWTSTNNSVAVISATGMGRGVGVGSAQLVGTIDGVSGSSAINVLSSTIDPPVSPARVASVSIAPTSVSITTGATSVLVATLLDSLGNVLSGRTISWTSSNAQVASVSSTGTVSGVGAGSATITATSEGVSGSASASVTTAAPAPVASITIAPTSISISTGATTQLVATARDANGNVLTGRSISWASSNGLIAGVSNGGAVTGLVIGSATITATSEGKSGSAGVSVTLLPPPPTGGGSWSNMPGTYSVVTEQPFDPLFPSGWEEIWDTGNYGTIINDATATLLASGGSSVFQVKYPAGFTAGTAPSTQWYPLGGRRNVFVGMLWKANAGWQGHESGVNKIHFLFPTSGGDMYMTAYGPPSGPFHLRVNLQFNGADTRSWLVPNMSSGAVSMGAWHKIEWLIESSTSGANGVVKWWLDGQLVGDYRDVLFPAGGFAEYKLSPTWGGMGGISKQQTDYFWYDHVTIGSR